uniref:Endo/exonuclease/phosphatase domain-containing protein n=1 Tax=Angiostrongylus cantonensis TaxID=6313 RepID=A0A0K0D7F2_ANGCA
MVTICTYNARTLASESSIEDLLMQARMIRYDVIGLAETRRRHPFHAVYDTGEKLFLGTRDSSGVGGVGVLVNTGLSMNIDSFEQLTTRITFTIMWINTGFDNLRRLRANIKL